LATLLITAHDTEFILNISEALLVRVFGPVCRALGSITDIQSKPFLFSVSLFVNMRTRV